MAKMQALMGTVSANMQEIGQAVTDDLGKSRKSVSAAALSGGVHKRFGDQAIFI